MRFLFGWFALIVAGAALAGPPDAARRSDIVFLGEVHDNPAHHAVQADWVAALRPTALVLEMLPEAIDVTAPVEIKALSAVWDAGGWPDFALYRPIFEAAPQAAVKGAGVSREMLRAVRETPLAETPDAALFGLDQPLPPEEQAAREALQHAAHCDALPPEMLPMMVDMQRLRDAALARAAVAALDRFGPPIAVITGNGHARRDWGAASIIDGVTIFALGQGEAGTPPQGLFDLTLDAPAVDRPDPCAAFTK